MSKYNATDKRIKRALRLLERGQAAKRGCRGRGGDDARRAERSHRVPPFEGTDERIMREAIEHQNDQMPVYNPEDLAEMDEAAEVDAINALKEDTIELAEADHGDALTLALAQWYARDAGAGVLAPALDAAPWSPGERAAQLAGMTHEAEHGADTGTNGFDRTGGDRVAAEGPASPPAAENERPAFELAAQRRPDGAPGRPKAVAGDLFGGPTSRDYLRALERARDAQRNGRNRPQEDFSNTDLGATPRGEAPEQVDLDTPEAQSTTYERTSSVVRRGGASEPANAAGRRERTVPGQLDRFVATRGDRPAAAAKAEAEAEASKLARLFMRAKVVATGVFKSGIKCIRDWKDAAHIIAPLRKLPQEQVLAVVADADGNPLAIVRHTIGLRAASQVDIGMLFGSIAQILGAKHVWFAHNHPSGTMEQSAADLALTKRLHDLMRGSGIEAHGMIQVGPGSREATYSNPDTGERGAAPGGRVTAAARTGEVPIVERTFRRIQTGNKVQITDPASATAAVRMFSQGQTGALLLDNHKNVVGFMPITDAEMARLRTGDPETGAAHVAAVATEANAASAIRVTRDVDAARNLGSLFDNMRIKPLDIAVLEPDCRIVLQGFKGTKRKDAKPFFARTGESRAPGDLSAAEVDRVASRVLGADAEKAGVHAVATFDELPDALRKAAEAEGVRAADIEAVHCRGHSYILADMMRDADAVRNAVPHELY